MSSLGWNSSNMIAKDLKAGEQWRQRFFFLFFFFLETPFSFLSFFQDVEEFWEWGSYSWTLVTCYCMGFPWCESTIVPKRLREKVAVSHVHTEYQRSLVRKKRKKSCFWDGSPLCSAGRVFPHSVNFSQQSWPCATCIKYF